MWDALIYLWHALYHLVYNYPEYQCGNANVHVGCNFVIFVYCRALLGLLILPSDSWPRSIGSSVCWVWTFGGFAQWALCHAPPPNFLGIPILLFPRNSAFSVIVYLHVPEQRNPSLACCRAFIVGILLIEWLLRGNQNKLTCNTMLLYYFD